MTALGPAILVAWPVSSSGYIDHTIIARFDGVMAEL